MVSGLNSGERGLVCKLYIINTMSHTFENSFSDYSSKTAESLLSTNNSVSNEFKNKLESYVSNKLEILNSNLRSDIFYDNSVYTGSAGVALFFYTLATHLDQPDYDFLLRSLDYIKLDKLKGKRISFLCGDAGPLAISTVALYKLGERRPETFPEFKTTAKKLMNLIHLLDESPEELLYGKSGYLYALLFVNKHTGNEVIPSDHIKKVILAILNCGKQFAAKIKSDSPLLWEWHEKIYLGGAHGVAGILYLLLQAKEYMSNDVMRDLIKPTLTWLLRLQFPSGNFPSSLGSSGGDRLVQWCHGAPGFVPLFILASQIFSDVEYLKTAERCGEVIWRRGLGSKGYSLCHGVAGNAYGFLQLYQVTQDPKHLYRACCFAEWCMEERPGTQRHPPDRPASLFEGLTGRIYLARDLFDPVRAAFPAYTV